MKDKSVISLEPGWQGTDSHPEENKEVLLQLTDTTFALGYYHVSWISDDPNDFRKEGKYQDLVDGGIILKMHINRWMYIPE